MNTEGFKRKLAAILSADVKGYSRLMGEDEDMTVRTLTGYREVMATLIQKHRGRVVDSPGDNLLAEFSSAVDAVRSAVETQEELKARNAELPENRRMEFRIGINLGDVIDEGGRIYGDGVNIAARVEGLAEGKGICISGAVFDQVRNKLAFRYEYLGEHAVKNIAEPVRVYRVLIEPGDTITAIREEIAKRRQLTPAILGVMAVLVLLTGALTIWNFYLRPSLRRTEIISAEKTAARLPDKPSIAVLPFSNLGGNPKQEYFSDGITNDVITDLSKFSELLVIASNTVFTYRGRPVKVKNLGRELGVRYVLEGSVQRAGDKVRINAQLIDATTGHHLWAERYDRDIKDLFVLQDEIVQTIVATLAVRVRAAERKRAMLKDTESLEGYDYLLRGMDHLSRKTRSTNREARKMFERAIELDSGYASAFVGLAQTHLDEFLYGWTEFPSQALQQAHDLARKALSLDETNSDAHRILAQVYGRRLQDDLAIGEMQRALELNPNDPHSHRGLGSFMLYSGQLDDAINSYKKALRFDPNGFAPGNFMNLALAYYLKGRYDDAVRMSKQGLTRNPNFAEPYIPLAAAYAQLGRSEEAASAAAMILRLHPFFELGSYGSRFRNPAHRAAIIDGLRKAGLK